MTHDVWLAKHPYLQPVADVHAEVEAALADGRMPIPAIPIWDDYVGDFVDGVPLLHSAYDIVDLKPADSVVESLVERLASNSCSSRMQKECEVLNAEMRRAPDEPGRISAWLLGKAPFLSEQSGVLHYLGWIAVATYLRPVTTAFGQWREEERWLRSYCPTCGAPPAMAQLSGTDPGRRRYLSCGRCGARWWYRRTGCPFCTETEKDDHRLAVVAVEGEALRIDYCESCRGYLKTYVGDGSEATLLADWTSIHLDFVALDRRLKRSALSLYQF
jgi:FdhE protein